LLKSNDLYVQISTFITKMQQDRIALQRRPIEKAHAQIKGLQAKCAASVLSIPNLDMQSLTNFQFSLEKRKQTCSVFENNAEFKALKIEYPAMMSEFKTLKHNQSELDSVSEIKS